MLLVFPNAIVLLARKKIWPPRRKLHKPVSFVFAIRGRNEAQELFLIPVVPEIARRAVTGEFLRFSIDPGRKSPVSRNTRFIILFIELLLRGRKMLPYTISEIIEIIMKKGKEKLKKSFDDAHGRALFPPLSATCAYPTPLCLYPVHPVQGGNQKYIFI